jgi:hypothetical protein
VSVEAAATRLAALLTYAGGALADPERHDLVFVPSIELRPLVRTAPPTDVWAVDGGQAVVADARCLQLAVTRAARVHWRDGASVLEDDGPLQAHLLGCGEERAALTGLGLPVRPDAAIDLNLLRDWAEWQAVADCVARAEPGGLVLVDGDLQPDWRIPASWLAELLEVADDRGVKLVGVTKHSSLARGGAPLLGQVEREGTSLFGPRGMWWAELATTRPDSGPDIRVVAARLDSDARFSFRVDLPGGEDPAPVLGALSALADDAAFPGYP